MNILSSPIWPSDMPDDRRVIALLGLVQISEEGMSNNVSLLDDLRAGKNCSQEAAAAISQLEQEIERLNALVAMHSDALQHAKFVIGTKCVSSDKDVVIACVMVNKAISATSETVSAWQDKHDNEIVSRAFELAADNASDDASEKYCRLIAERLRAKGE